MATQSIERLGDLDIRHLWYFGPGGSQELIIQDYEVEAGDHLSLPGDSVAPDGPWWDLDGALIDGRWEWNGSGSPTDWRGNTVQK